MDVIQAVKRVYSCIWVKNICDIEVCVCDTYLKSEKKRIVIREWGWSYVEATYLSNIIELCDMSVIIKIFWLENKNLLYMLWMYPLFFIIRFFYFTYNGTSIFGIRDLEYEWKLLSFK